MSAESTKRASQKAHLRLMGEKGASRRGEEAFAGRGSMMCEGFAAGASRGGEDDASSEAGVMSDRRAKNLSMVRVAPGGSACRGRFNRCIVVEYQRAGGLKVPWCRAGLEETKGRQGPRKSFLVSVGVVGSGGWSCVMRCVRITGWRRRKMFESEGRGKEAPKTNQNSLN